MSSLRDQLPTGRLVPPSTGSCDRRQHAIDAVGGPGVSPRPRRLPRPGQTEDGKLSPAAAAPARRARYPAADRPRRQARAGRRRPSRYAATATPSCAASRNGHRAHRRPPGSACPSRSQCVQHPHGTRVRPLLGPHEPQLPLQSRTPRYGGEGHSADPAAPGRAAGGGGQARLAPTQPGRGAGRPRQVPLNPVVPGTAGPPSLRTAAPTPPPPPSRRRPRRTGRC